MAAHRYWRLSITAGPKVRGGLEFYAEIGELVFATTPGGPSVASGGVASASTSYAASHVPTNAFDGTLGSTEWASVYGMGPHWIQYDFGASPKDIVEVRIFVPLTIAPSRGYVMWHSEDGELWTEQRRWFTEDIVAGTFKEFDLTVPSSPTNRLVRQSTRSAAAANPMFPLRSALGRVPNALSGVAGLRPLRRTPFTGRKRIVGSTTILGIPAGRRVQLHEQSSGVLVDVVHTKSDGLWAFNNLADAVYTLLGVDVTGEQNSVVYAHITPVE